MKKLTLLLILMVLSTNVLAEWTEFYSDETGADYVDLQSIRKKENKVKMWTLDDFKSVQIFTDGNIRRLSQVGHYEYDCSEETIRQLDFSWYSGNMGNGEVVYSDSNMNHEPESIIPSTIGEKKFNIACSKKTKEKVVNNTQKYKWSIVNKTDNFIGYEDKSTIRRHGKFVTVVSMIDYNKPLSSADGKPYFSSIDKSVIDCDNLNYRTLTFQVISGHMGKGDIIYSVELASEVVRLTKESLFYKLHCTN